MTTQEKLAKHLGVNINEPFRVAEWNHPILHVDPNMGVVTKDGDRLSNVMLQELLFGDKITVEKLGKRKFNICKWNYSFRRNYFSEDLYSACSDLEGIAKHLCYHDAISAFANIMAEKYRNDFKHIDEIIFYFDKHFINVIAGADCFARINENGIMFAMYDILCENGLTIIAHNMLVKYVSSTGLDSVKSKEEISNIISDISNNVTVDDTPQELINELIERTKNNGQNS